MKKTHKIIYWIATAWLSLGMLSTGYVQLFHLKDETKFILDLGYPEYLLTLLGITKVLGVLVILIPKFPLLKEWAYAGFFFMMAGAVYSHVAAGNAGGIFPPLLLLILTVVSWYFRPVSRKLAVANQ